MDGLKQRIVGAVVLVSLAIIFIPMVFEQSHQARTSHVISIPPEPEVPKFTIEDPKPPKLRYSETPQPIEVEAVVEGKEPAELRQEIVETDFEQDAIELASPEPVDRSVDESQADKPKPIQPKPEPEKTAQKVPVLPAPEEVTKLDAQVKDLSLDERGDPVAWAVQIGTFKNRESAFKIRDELNQENIPAFTQEFQSGGDNLVRVFAGPTLKREQADRLKSKMDTRYQVSSLVVRYKPAN
ncbi:SPOR domain-containing protein [Hahella ganghwensis]|uniref:SPOR domain-containing protein n=1 Tax=Hahella ganghwensis TaxID=286420 RepID=UPI000360EB0A|nr:SPOR domain-containing protein [Hahella ganghwensis]